MQVFRGSIWVDGAHIWRRHGDRWSHRPAGGHAAEYESAVLGLLNRVSSNPAGILLLTAIRQYQHGKVQVVPYRGEGGPANAESVPWNFLAASPQGETVRDTEGHVWSPHHPVAGTGGGSDVFVRYSPGTWSHGRHAGEHPDEVLFHELSHAFRQLRGHNLLLGAGDEFLNQEEFWATLTTNVYISAKRAGLPLRGSYVRARDVRDRADAHVENVDGTRITESEMFVVNNRSVVQRLFDEERVLTERLSGVPCTFNPFRDYLRMTGASSLFARHMDDWR
jgi:hypothetical protein